MSQLQVSGGDLENELQQLNRDISSKKREHSDARAAADAIAEKYRADGVNPLTDEAAFQEVDAAYKAADSLADELVRMESVRDRGAAWHSEKGGRVAQARSMSQFESIAAKFMSSDSYKAAEKAGLFTSTKGRLEIQGVEALDRMALMARLNAQRGMMAATVDGSPLVPSQRLDFGAPILLPVRQPRILDLLTVTTTDSNLIQYTAMLTRGDVAAATALGSAYPEANYVFELREAPVRDIGQWVPAHRSELADQGQLQALLERLLQFGVDLALESEVLAGDGTGEHITGILETDGINSVSRNGTTAERRVEVLHRAITATRLTLFGEPDGMVLHPTDYEETLFEKTDAGDGGYVWIGALAGLAGNTPQSLWGKPVVTTPVMPQNTGLVGAFKAGGVVYINTGVTVRASDSHEDFFTRRMVAVLAETRAAFAVPIPAAFCEVSNI